jgi:sugar phosphate isomerase/epimerase
MHPIIGINLPDCRSLEQLQGNLTTLEKNGFDCVEINLEMFPLIIEGEICTKWVDVLKSELERHPFLYSAHMGRGLDLRNTKDRQLHVEVLHSSLRICKELGCDPLVLHYEEKSKDNRVEQQFFEAHKEASDFAGELGIMLCIENIEVEHIDPVIELVEKLDRDNVRLSLDTGHAYLASRYFHFDLFATINRTLPYLGHVHLSDNTGRFEELRLTNRPVYDALPMGYRREFGRGDIHLPPYFGKIPFDEIFTLLKDYRGKYICEYTSDSFLPFNGEIQQHVRQKILAMAE